MIFRFTLTNNDSGAFILPNDPRGWADIEIALKRGTQYHGTFYEVALQLEFTCNSGKEYIDNIYDNHGGIDAVIGIKIDIACNANGKSDIASDYSDDYSDDYGSIATGQGYIVYETLYEGVLDLKTYSKTSKSTFADLIQSDFIQKVLNRFNTSVELTQNISLDNTEVDPISETSITLHGKSIVIQTDYDALEGIGDSIFVLQQDGINIEVPVFANNDDFGGASPIDSPYTFSFFQSGGARGYDKTQPLFVNNSGEEINITIDWNIVGDLLVKHSFDFTGNFFFLLQVGGTQFAYVPFPDTLQNINSIDFESGLTKTINVNAVGSGVYNLPAGEKIYLCFYFTDVAGNNVTPYTFEFISFNKSTFEFKLSSVSTADPTSAPFYLIHETGAAIAQRITSDNDSFRSALIGRKNSMPNSYDDNGCFSFAGILNGKHIRGISSPLFCSMDDFFMSLNSYYPLGLGFEKENNSYKLRLEERSFFYDSTEVLFQFININEIKTSVAKEHYVSELNIGFQEWEIENINGLNEINSKRTYNTGIKAIDNKIDLESRFVGAMYAIELTRRKGANTTDSKYDDLNFIVCTKRSVDGSGVPAELNIAEKNENFTAITGVLAPETAYNLRISPVRNLLRHVKYISQSIYKYAGGLIKFTYGEGNNSATTMINDSLCSLNNFNNTQLSENQDVAWDNTNIDGQPIYLPEYLEFEYPLSFTDYLICKNNPYKCIEVSETNSNFIKGFIIEIRYKPVRGIAYFKLLKAWQ